MINGRLTSKASLCALTKWQCALLNSLCCLWEWSSVTYYPVSCLPIKWQLPWQLSIVEKVHNTKIHTTHTHTCIHSTQICVQNANHCAGYKCDWLYNQCVHRDLYIYMLVNGMSMCISVSLCGCTWSSRAVVACRPFTASSSFFCSVLSWSKPLPNRTVASDWGHETRRSDCGSCTGSQESTRQRLWWVGSK